MSMTLVPVAAPPHTNTPDEPPRRDFPRDESPRHERTHKGLAEMNLEGLVFGCEDVLYDASEWQRWLRSLLGYLGLGSRQHLVAAWRSDYQADVDRGLRSLDEALSAFLATLGLPPCQIEEIEAASHARLRQARATLRPFCGVLKALGELRTHKVALVVLTNSQDSSQRTEARLDEIGLAGAFDCVISSAELGTAKPEPAAYQAALSAVGLRCTQVAYVGHDAQHLAGARRTGMATVAFNQEPHAMADTVIERFDELPQVVLSRSSYRRAA